jgi:putative transposase
MSAVRELAPRMGVLATHLIDATCTKQGIQAGELTLHAERGSSMRSKPVAFLLADLGVTVTHARPQVSNDNPFSEAPFRTLKYRPDFPARFGSLPDARAHCADFFRWYHNEHHHSGIALMTPDVAHHRLADQVQRDLCAALDQPAAALRRNRVTKCPVRVSQTR